MRLLARRKVVLVIVEGVSEETALGIALSNVYDKDAVYIHIMHGDITTRKGVNSKNIVSKIGNDVKTYAKSQHFTAINFKQIIYTMARNEQKRDNLFRLRNCGNIWNIPYRVYYMSCNLDHVLYDKRNSSDEEKENNAYEFAKKYKDNLEEFIKFICKSTFSVNGDYRESWNYIEKDMNSIDRHTNFSICIEEEMGQKEQ